MGKTSVCVAGRRPALVEMSKPGDLWPSSPLCSECRTRRWPNAAFSRVAKRDSRLIASLLALGVDGLVRAARDAWRRRECEAAAAAAIAVPSPVRHTESTFWMYLGKIGGRPNARRIAASPKRQIAVAVFVVLARRAERAFLVWHIRYAEQQIRESAARLAELDEFFSRPNLGAHVSLDPPRYTHRYVTETGEPLADCPLCGEDLVTGGVLVTLSVAGRLVENVPSRLNAAGVLQDTEDGAIAAGFHSETRCSWCDESLADYEEASK